MIPVLVLSGVRAYAEALAASLGEYEGIEVVGWAVGTMAALSAVQRTRPCVIVMDPAVPEQIALVRQLKARVPALGVVALTATEDDDVVVACAEVGVCGYVTADASIVEVAQVVRAVANGHAACSPRTAA